MNPSQLLYEVFFLFVEVSELHLAISVWSSNCLTMKNPSQLLYKVFFLFVEVSEYLYDLVTVQWWCIHHSFCTKLISFCLLKFLNCILPYLYDLVTIWWWIHRSFYTKFSLCLLKFLNCILPYLYDDLVGIVFVQCWIWSVSSTHWEQYLESWNDMYIS